MIRLSGEKIVAKAYDQVLYKDDLKGIIPAGSSAKDSVNIIKDYIDTWLRKQAVIQKAEENLPG